MYALRLRTRRLTERNATCNYLSRNSSPRNRIITRRVRQLRDYEQEDAPRTCLLEASTNFRATNLSTCNANHAIRQVGPKIFSRGRTRRKLILIFSTSLRASKFANDDSTRSSAPPISQWSLFSSLSRHFLPLSVTRISPFCNVVCYTFLLRNPRLFFFLSTSRCPPRHLAFPNRAYIVLAQTNVKLSNSVVTRCWQSPPSHCTSLRTSIHGRDVF